MKTNVRVKWRRSLRNKKAFTLAELLIVVAIIGVLVAISIPIFANQLEKSRQAADLANLRNAYADAASDAITQGGEDGVAESAIMKHSGAFNLLNEAILGDLDLKTSDASPVVKDYSVIITVSAEDGSVSLDVGNGGKVEGTAATAGELAAITGGNTYSKPLNASIGESVDGNVLYIDKPADVASYPKVEGTYGVPTTYYTSMSSGYRYYKWDGANWYYVDKEGDPWTIVHSA